MVEGMETSYSAIDVIADSRVRYMVMMAAAMAAKALTDTDQDPERRLHMLMEGHGRVLAARGPGNSLPFSVFRELLTGDLSLLLPGGVPAEELSGVRLVTPDGQFDDDIYDLEQEQRDVLRALAATTRDGRATSGTVLEAEMDQDKVYSALRKRMVQEDYVHGRSSLIRTPAGADGELRRLNLPSAIAEFYRPISYAALFDRWWFPCPICRWPMRIVQRGGRGARTGAVRCFHRPHADRGAQYSFKIPDIGKPPTLVPIPGSAQPPGNASVLAPRVNEHVPEPVPADGHKALTRGVWRWTTIPGLVEIGLYDALTSRGLAVQLWPDIDSYDLHVEAGGEVFRVDVKDYSSAILLAKKIDADEGDAGGAEWLVVPDHNESSVPLLTTVSSKYRLNVATAGDFGEQLSRRVGARWA